MTNYIQLNYPENFNDWIDSSEFIALIDLISYLGESLAFRIDINARENFIDTATRRESVLRLARFLSYSPHRNIPAQGLVKLVQISTNDDVFDSLGNNLNNQTIVWNDPTNTNWFEQWILVMNNSFIPTNPFGTPLKDLVIQGIDTQLYRLNNIPIGPGNFPFTSFVDNNSLNFDICNVDFSSSGGFSELHPDPQAAFQLIYRSDGNGNTSPNTGFFLLFKQGTLQRTDFQISQPLENRKIYINTQNINQNDVWVHTVNDSGFIVTNGIWTRVGYVPTDDLSKVLVSIDNVTYNSIDAKIQNIFQVVTQENDQIMLRFGDGRFGQIPTGNLRVWYRVSANQSISITPDEMQNLRIDIPYLSSIQSQKTLHLNFSLQGTVANGSLSENSDDIARRAALNYSTQARMVSGDDYNILPSTNNQALKVKAINRVYSGQNRFIDLNDPTGNYQNTNVFSDDGAIYIEMKNIYTEVANKSNLSPSEIASFYITPLIKAAAVYNFILNEWLTGMNPEYSILTNSNPIYKWIQSNDQIFSNSGNFARLDTNLTAPIGQASVNGIITRYIVQGSLVKFAIAGWVTVVSVQESGTSAVLSQVVATNDTVVAILPYFQDSFRSEQIAAIVQLINSKRTFGIGYDFITQNFLFIDVNNLNISQPDGSIAPYDFSTARSGFDSSWLIVCNYTPSSWNITARGLDYVFESIRDVKFFFNNNYKTINTVTGKSVQDSIKIIKSSSTGTDYYFTLADNYTYSDGYIEPRRVLINFSAVLNNGLPDNPESFTNLVGANSLIFHQRLIDQNGYEYYQLLNHTNVNVLPPLSVIPTTGVFYQLTLNDDLLLGSFYVNGIKSLDYTVHHGLDNIYFQWKHYAPIDQRIDPALSNIIDILVLQSAFYDSMVIWRTNGCDPTTLPVPPNENTLQILFSALEQFKMFSDQIVWRPVKFKLLFGPSATPPFRLTFKVVPLLGAFVSNGQIQSRLLAAVNKFFDVSSWDFGETFYYSELGGYLHSQLSDCVASVVPVPLGSNQSFGDLFEIRCNSDELFFPTLQVSDIEIIPSNTQTSLRINTQ